MFKNLAISSSAFIIAIVLGELFFRLANIPPEPIRMPRIGVFAVSENPILGHELVPNFSSADLPARLRSKKLFLNLTTNSAGFRDREYPVERSADVIRIAALGDSTTFGYRVGDLETWPQYLEEILNHDLEEKPRFEVINMGVLGYDTLQEAEFFRVKGSRYRPDLVILAFCLNDFVPNVMYGGAKRAIARIRELESALDVAPLPSNDGIFAWLLRRSRLVFVTYHRIVHLRSARESAAQGEGDQESRIYRGFSLLRESQQAREFEVLIVLIPHFAHSFEQYRDRHWHAKVKKMVSSFPSFRILDPLEGFREHEEERSSLTLDGIHMTARGNELLAVEVKTALEKEFPRWFRRD